MQMNLTIKQNQDFSLTLALQSGNGIPLALNSALFYMDIKEKENGNIKIATLSNDDTVDRQGFVYIKDLNLAKIKLFLSKDIYEDKKFINTWRYDLIIKQFDTYSNIISGNFTISDSVTEV